MSSIPYNYGSYIDAKVAMTDTGHVSAGKQIQSPASAGSRGLAKTTQFTNDRTQMQMGNSPIAESMIEIRNIMNRIDGINVPTNEMNELADDEKMEFTKILLDISVIRDRIERLSVDDDAKKSAIQSLKNAEEALVALDETAVKEDAGEDEKVVDMLRNIKQHLENHPNMSEHPSLVALDQLADDLESGDKPADYESAVREDADINDLKRWYKRYSEFEGFNGDKLPFGLYMQMAQTGVPTDGMEASEARKAIADQNPNLDPNDAESLAGSAEEIPGVDFDKADAPITNRMKSELATIMGVDAIGEEEITKAMKMLGVIKESVSEDVGQQALANDIGLFFVKK